ncbi:hypothetical protein HPULCUR_011622 [Helicostylum pulchrum]|uniref:Uncharacterized protein n=1 Tax=Helicostylum pulchrum TaxID=562976 RepID=A0ABP9YGL6_9FUNG
MSSRSGVIFLRYCSRESIRLFSNYNKTEQYRTSKYVKSLKVNFRLIVDLENGDEFDVAAGEYTLVDTDDKDVADEGKLTREAKDALDGITKYVPKDLKGSTCWRVQTTGPHCGLCTMDLDANGLYVNIHR